MSHLWIMFLEYIKISYSRILWILLFGLALFIILLFLERGAYIKGGRKGSIGVLAKLALSVLLASIFILTLFNRTRGDYGVNLVPFSSYYLAFANQNTELLLQCIMNVLLHIALGFLLPCCYTYFAKIGRVLKVTLIYSACVEAIQGIIQIGYVEVDDVINSLVGAFVGVILFKVIIKVEGEK